VAPFRLCDFAPISGTHQEQIPTFFQSCAVTTGFRKCGIYSAARQPERAGQNYSSVSLIFQLDLLSVWLNISVITRDDAPMTPHQAIEQIDKQIDANRRALMARLHFGVGRSAHEWQAAWDRCPDLYARERDLYRQRGLLQEQRNAADNRAWQAEQRKERARLRRAEKNRKPCPTCGLISFAA
jgi:hypothetical protein